MNRMGHSSWIGGAAFSLAACVFLAGCLVESRSPASPRYDGSDTADINPNGTRKVQPPRVTYRTHDSVVFLDIAGKGPGYQNWYWIYRNGELLDQPSYAGYDSGVDHFTLSDSLRAGGDYAYTVRFGYTVSDLGPKSPAFLYAYPGRSPSGTVSLATDEAQAVQVKLKPPPHAGAARARFERRIGREGGIAALDSLDMPEKESMWYRDTGFVPYDTMLYYRAAIMDAETEAWLAPTAWDSLRVYNRSWNYVPETRLENLGAGVQVAIRNPFSYDGLGRGFYFLYRGRSPVREEGTRCDSLPMVSISLLLKDAPPDTGTWYYWAEARDSHGRNSPRSTPVAARISGDPVGPGIRDITVYSSILYVRGRPYENATAYILQRSPDTTLSPTDADTLTGAEAQRDPEFVDAPPGDGFWFYRVIAVAGNKPSSPGRWSRSDYFRRQDSYSTLYAPIRNLGARGVQAELPYSAFRISLLYRSSRSDGADSAAVDSILPADTSKLLRDMPSKGAWYYRVYAYEKPTSQGYTVYRTAWARVDFSGQAVGPAVLSLDKLGTGIDVRFALDPDAIAYIVERSPDTSGIWTVIDTLAVFAGSPLAFSDHPPHNGNWSYRARTLTRELTATDPGPFLATPSPWSFRVAYENGLSARIFNRGDRVECPLTTTSTYGYYFKRGPADDYSDPVTVDSARIGDADAKMTDEPSHNTWYYWVERMIPAGSNSGSILRSVPVRVEFNGGPEAVSLSRVSGGIRIAYPEPDRGDTLEIWRSSGMARDTADFSLAMSIVGPVSTEAWVDPTPDPGTSAFYRYRLILRSAKGATGFGPAKTFYYEPD